MHLSIYHAINIPQKTTNAIVNDIPDYIRQKITKKSNDTVTHMILKSLCCNPLSSGYVLAGL
jgi:hypothetical protein